MTVRLPMLAMLALVVLSAATFSATPPTTVNYQGVLRSATDKPLTGTYDMTFRFFDASSGGNELLVDTHAAAGSGAVTASGGLFNTLLGGGTVTDGSGAGTYTNLGDVFRDFNPVFVEIRVGAETLSPRVKVQSSAYALNATNLNGRAASGYVDTSATRQTKSGTFRFETADPANAVLDVVSDPGSPRAMWVQKGTNVCKLQDGSSGIDCTGSSFGVKGSGATSGGYFAEASGASVLYASTSGFGANGVGSVGGAYFSDTGGSSGYAAHSGNGIEGYGSGRGGKFGNTGNASVAELSTIGGYGVYGNGTSVGGYFSNSTGGGGDSSYLAYGSYGIKAYGSYMGGYVSNTLGDSYAQLGLNGGFGVLGYGSTSGGYFKDNTSQAYAYVGNAGYGIKGYGSTGGGYFQDASDGSKVYLASAGSGIYAVSPSAGGGQGGYFTGNLPSFGDVYAVLGTDRDSPYGGPFAIKAVNSISLGSNGAWAGDFIETHSGVFTRVAYVGNTDSASIQGNGAKNFVQNHPYDPTKLIAYSSLEGDEVGTYTRGTGRLVGGEAHVALGETFAWVTNPDVGLTAQVTPRGSAALLFVVSLSPTELVVRSASGDANAAFDYVVHGLRLGFEQFTVVNDRTARNEAKLPSVSLAEQELAKRPDLQSYTALARFRKMTAAAGLTVANDDMARGLALRQAIGEYDQDRDREALAGPVPHAPPPVSKAPLPVGSAPTAEVARVPLDRAETPADRPPVNSIEVAIAGTAAVGDVLALDPDGGDALRVATVTADPSVVGIVTGDGPSTWSGTAAIALGGSIVLCRVDATYGAIARGELLVASATPGHAMRAGAAPAPGTIVAKALEAWPSGIGTIRVLVMAR